MSSPLTEVFLPKDLHFPVKVQTVECATSTTVTRGTRLLTLTFIDTVRDGDEVFGEVRFHNWDSPIEGELVSLKVKQGDVITAKEAREKAVVEIREPCRHSMQFMGLCTACGKDMTNLDYTGFSDATRATIAMTHDANGPLVSLEEAERLEKESAEQMLKARKLYLIVDLDQTIVHAAVDPTIGEWIAEGEAWEAREKKDGDEDECNPNWEALKDVKQFKLAPESFGPASLRAAHKGKNAVETEGCTYYFKPRPGWDDFLHHAAKKYEMHVYTMGTRAYAEGVLAAIDPDGRLFGGRVLSRDESGSLTQKNLRRLFPCDQSMVVIIDDRADVWEWSPNLIKVIPYTFFPSIGDINSAFLPKVEPTTAKEEVGPLAPRGVDTTTVITPPVDDEEEIKELQTTVLQNAALDAQLEERPLAKKEKELQEQDEEESKELQTTVLQNAALDAQLEERPLAKKEKELQERDEGDAEPLAEPPAETSNGKVPEKVKEKLPKREKHHRKAFLTNDDYELIRIGELLHDVHTRFYDAYDASKANPPTRRKSKNSQLTPKLHDVTLIIPQMRMEVLRGVHMVFSGIIPLDMRPETVEAWKLAHMFGARCSTQLVKGVTHVVAKNRTAKVQEALKRGNIFVVNEHWFHHSIALCRRQRESKFPVPLDDNQHPGGSQRPPEPKKKPTTAPAPPEASTSGIKPTKVENSDSGSEASASPPPQTPPSTSPESDTAVVAVDSDTTEATPEATTTTEEKTPAAKGPAMDDALDELENVTAITNESLKAWTWDAPDGDDAEFLRGLSDDDDDDYQSQRSGMESDDGYASASSAQRSSKVKFSLPEDPESPETESPNRKRKRHGSATPSDAGSVTNGDDDLLKSPLAKRKKLAAERVGASKLKEDVTQQTPEASTPPTSSPSKPEASSDDSTVKKAEEDEDEDEEEDEEEEEDYDDGEDFLADALDIMDEDMP